MALLVDMSEFVVFDLLILASANFNLLPFVYFFIFSSVCRCVMIGFHRFLKSSSNCFFFRKDVHSFAHSIDDTFDLQKASGPILVQII